MDKLTDEQIEMVLALEAKATPGPWEFEHPTCKRAEDCGCEVTDASGNRLFDTFNRDYKVSSIELESDEDGAWWTDIAGMKDLRLAAFARNHIGPALLELRELRKAATESTRLLDAIAAAHLGRDGTGWTYVPETLANEIANKREELRELRAEVARLKEKPCDCERLLLDAEAEHE